MDLIAWIYIGIVLLPLSFYLSIKRPFIFPFGAYVFLLPFDSILSVTSNVQGATLTKFLGILSVVVLVLTGIFENRLKRPSGVTIWWVLFVAFGILSISWAIQPYFVLARIPTAVSLLVFYLVVATFKIQKSEFETLKWCILLGGLLAALYSIFSYITGDLHEEHSLRSSIAFGERATDPNQFAFSLIISVAVCIQMMLKQNTFVKKALLWIVLGIFLFSIIITGSRGGLLGTATVIIVYILFTKKRVTLGVISIVLGIILVSLIPEFFIERWAESIETGGAGRLSIWYIGLKALSKYWVVGAGLSNFPKSYSEFVVGGWRAAHNIYLETLVELGIIGFSLFVFAIIKHYRLIQLRFNRYNYDQVLLKAAFWSALVSSFFLDTVWRKTFWLIWMMILMYRNVLRGENESDFQIATRNNSI
jgi:O-antigen ligase